MPRLNPVELANMSPEARRIYDVITSTRKGGLGGPFSVWIHAPSLAEPANLLHNAFRVDGKLDRRLFEMLILIVANEYKAQYVWSHHKAQAMKVGLSADIIENIGDGQRPTFTRAEEETLYETTVELLRRKTLDSDAYDRALRTFGATLLIEVVSAVGFYSMVCLLVNSFDVPARSH
jgi:4-carboxymuconolactone decarboxylase